MISNFGPKRQPFKTPYSGRSCLMSPIKMPSKLTTMLFLALFFFSFFTRPVNCFSWRPHMLSNGGNQVTVEADRKLSGLYSTALEELQQLESEPLCHRIAARQLVNNCHLLDGQNEAKIHIDSGRAARDFVDFYAASLAICDLERGSFTIPKSCFKFREPFLAALPTPTVAELHVATNEIDGCLEGLAQSDSAWNTWVSYRHKALRFCDAARVDNRKDEDIFVYQKITKILEKLTDNIEADMEERFRSLHRAFDATSQSVESMGLQAKHLQMDMEKAGAILRNDLRHAVQDSRDIVRSGLEEAQTLHDLLEILVHAVQERSDNIALSQEVALRTNTQKLNDEVGILMTALAAAVTSSHSQIELAAVKSADVLKKQAKIEEGMTKLEELADNLALKYGNHETRLDEALQKSNHVLDVLEETAASAAGLQGYVFNGLVSWLRPWFWPWPYVVCPMLSLVMGSYRLEPSAVRNLWLFGIGEAVGILISKGTYFMDLIRHSTVTKTTTAPTPNQSLAITEWEVIDKHLYLAR